MGPAPQVLFLGVESDMRPLDGRGLVRMSVSTDRKKRLVAYFEEVLHKGRLTPSTAAHISGKLGFTLMWAYGRFGRAAMQPINRRATESGRAVALHAGLVASLTFFQDTIPRLAPHEFVADTVAEPPTLIWSDGRFDMDLDGPIELRDTAGVGYVVAVPRPGAGLAAPGLAAELRAGSQVALRDARIRLATLYDFFHGSSVVPKDFMEGFSLRRQYIGQVELLGAFAPYLSVPHLLEGRRVIHWIDNSAALAGLTKGYSGVTDSVRLVHAFHAFTVGLGVRIWFEYVPTKANISDAPSRRDLREVFFRLRVLEGHRPGERGRRASNAGGQALGRRRVGLAARRRASVSGGAVTSGFGGCLT